MWKVGLQGDGLCCVVLCCVMCLERAGALLGEFETWNCARNYSHRPNSVS